MGDDTSERFCSNGSTMLKNGDGELECDGFDCDCHIGDLEDDED